MRCRCGRTAVYHRRQSGQYLCSTCFSKSIHSKFRKTIRAYNYIKKGDTIAVALSGGKDSTVLLHLLWDLQKDRPFEMAAIIIDEGISNYREKTIGAAVKNCNTLGVESHIFSFEQEFGITIDACDPNVCSHCSFCGVLRRYLLNQKARELGAGKLAVGLNLDDEVQSVLMNFLRGDLFRFGRTGPSYTESPHFVPRIKPLRTILEKEVMLYAVLARIDVDHSVCPYASEALRGDIRDFLDSMESKRPTTKYSLLKSYDRLVPYFQEQFTCPISLCSRCGEPTVGTVCKTCSMLEAIKKMKER
ncbi:MAG: TIGR00269 family protein [Theionarchaea archaeon]|nr:TIGR00269 family protein [Theionarchaea archaeon]MBU7038353.1 TIGR00269 family protein [Theionarchaea archaeon]